MVAFGSEADIFTWCIRGTIFQPVLQIQHKIYRKAAKTLGRKESFANALCVIAP